MVLLSERDALALEWETHQVRWLLSNLLDTARSAANPWRMPPRAPGARRWRGEDEPEDYNAQADARWETLLSDLQALTHAHDREREWWSLNKQSAPLPLLRAAVRRMMSEAGGARAPELSALDAPAEEEPPAQIRSLRWLLRVRGEIARRRMLCGEIVLLAREGGERGQEWTSARLGSRLAEPGTLADRISELNHGDASMSACQSLTQLRALVLRRETAAARHGVTGAHHAPALLNLDQIGAGDCLSRDAQYTSAYESARSRVGTESE